MKKYFLIAFSCYFLSSSKAQSQLVPVPLLYNTPSSANLCMINDGFSIEFLDVSPIGPPSNFTLALQVYVVTSTSQPLPGYPTTWPSNYPECYLGSSNLHPIALEACSVSNSCDLINQPAFSPATNSFDWVLSNCSGAPTIETIEYDIYLDCSIYSMLISPSNSLYLIQEWYYKDANGNMFPFPLQPVAVPITYPIMTAPSNPVHVSANYGNTEGWLIAYQNIGTGPANIISDFEIVPCPEYDLGDIEYSTGTAPGQWDTYIAGQTTTYPPGEPRS